VAAGRPAAPALAANARRLPSAWPDSLADALHEVYARVLPAGAPQLTVGYGANRASDPLPGFGAVADELRAAGGLTEPQVVSFPWHRDRTRDQWLAELHSHSDHAALAPELRQELFREIGRAIDSHGGGFRMTFTSTLMSATRRA
jgi:hypothetical protein